MDFSVVKNLLVKNWNQFNNILFTILILIMFSFLMISFPDFNLCHWLLFYKYYKFILYICLLICIIFLCVPKEVEMFWFCDRIIYVCICTNIFIPSMYIWCRYIYKCTFIQKYTIKKGVFIIFLKKVQTVMISNSTNINETINHPLTSPKSIEHKKRS
jgi:hypothetical protein